MDILVTEASGNAQIFRDFADLARNMRHPQAALRRAGEDYLQTIDLRHERESWQMRRWPALSPRYKRFKDENFPGRKILERTGKMRESYYYKVSRNQLRIGNTSGYWHYHEHLPQNAHLDRGIMPTRRTATPTQYNLDRMTRIIAGDLIPRRIRGQSAGVERRSGRGFGERRT